MYVDDVIVYSKNIDEHLHHLELTFTILENSGCTMSIHKCHFAQPGLKALGHFVSRLGLSTTDEKTEAIRNLAMPTSLQDLETGLGLMGYYQEFVPDYAIIARPLNELKTLGFKGSPKSNPQRDTFARKSLFPPDIVSPAEYCISPGNRNLVKEANVPQRSLAACRSSVGQAEASPGEDSRSRIPRLHEALHFVR